MAKDYSDQYERAAGGLDFDDAIRDKAASIGAGLLDGPEKLFEQIEEMLPEQWREHIATFPVTALVAGFAVGIFLGARKGDQLIAAGSALVTAAVAANVNSVLGQNR